MIENYLPDIVGQDSVKQKLAMYKLSYQGGAPVSIVYWKQGSGKSNLASIRSACRQEWGHPPMLEVNASAIRNVDSFYDQIYSKWSEHALYLLMNLTCSLINFKRSS